MTTSAKNYTKKKKGQTEPQDKWLKQSYTDKITKEAYTLTKTEKGKKYIDLYIKKRKSATKSINKSTNDNKF